MLGLESVKWRCPSVTLSTFIDGELFSDFHYDGSFAHAVVEREKRWFDIVGI